MASTWHEATCSRASSSRVRSPEWAYNARPGREVRRWSLLILALQRELRQPFARRDPVAATVRGLEEVVGVAHAFSSSKNLRLTYASDGPTFAACRRCLSPPRCSCLTYLETSPPG